jgi:predicted small lipoprotein YifL
MKHALLALAVLASLAACGGGGGSDESELTPAEKALLEVRTATAHLADGDDQNLYVTFDTLCKGTEVEDIGNDSSTTTSFRMWVKCAKRDAVHVVTFDNDTMRPTEVQIR